MLNDWTQRLPKYLRNKYALTLIAFALWMIFFDQNDVLSQLQLKQELYELQREKEYYQEQILKTRADLENLLSDNEKLERFAREKYLMKKSNEEIFVIVVED